MFIGTTSDSMVACMYAVIQTESSATPEKQKELTKEAAYKDGRLYSIQS